MTLHRRSNVPVWTLLRRSMASTVAAVDQPNTTNNNKNSSSDTKKSTRLPVDDTTNLQQQHNHMNTKITTPTVTTTTTNHSSFKSGGPLTITTSSFHSPIPVNYHRSQNLLTKLIQTRVRERDTYMNVNSIFAAARSSGESESSFLSACWNMLQMAVQFRIPTTMELDGVFPIRPICWEQIQQYSQHHHHHNTTKHHQTTTTTTTKPVTSRMMQVTWLGHSSLLIQYPNGTNVLTDPIFSPYCSPNPHWWGPRRFRPTPCSLSELLQHISIDLVLISHNHYDHLDFPTIQALHEQNPDRTQFVVPLGLQQWLRRYIHPHIRTYELDWYEHMIHSNTNSTTSHDDDENAMLQIKSVPMKHWSSRYGYDRDRTLWCGYSLEYIPSHQKEEERGTASKFLFSGDTAYYDGMADCVLAEPQKQPQQQQDQQVVDASSSASSSSPKHHFDVAAIPIGAYEPRAFMYHNHMNVEEAIQMKDDLSCRYAIPIHWGTFPLTIEPVMEPRDKLRQFMEHRVDANTFIPWCIGETKQY